VQRRFGVEELAALPRDDRRKLVQVLLQERGARIVEFQTQATHDELVAELSPLWHRSTIRIRIACQSVDQTALDRLATRVQEAGDTEGVIITPFGMTAGASPAPAVNVVSAHEFLARLERSALVSWNGGLPAPSYEMLASQQGLNREAALLDPIGLRWLPTLSLNELPPDLADVEIAPDKLFERVAFRLMTSSLRFGGERSGESTPGQRVPDATLLWPAASSAKLAALFDAKAAGDGYTMTGDHLLRFCSYVETLKPTVDATGYELAYLIVLSSSFPGGDGDQHPFHGRARELATKVGVKLVYMRAIDLARLAVSVEARGLSPTVRELLPWAQVFDQGLVRERALAQLLPEAA
jgi:hypothetical protein